MKSFQQDFQPNGCGGKGGLIDPPDWIFREDCNRHDLAYHEGGSEQDRLFADKLFLANMLASVAKVAWYRRPFLKSQAWLYYRSVRIFGAKYFNYRNE